VTTMPITPAIDERLRDVLAGGDRPAPPGAPSAAITLGWRALLKIKHVPEQLFDVIMFPIMVTVVFTYLLGGALAGSPREYAQYLIPGILVQTVVLTTMYTGVALCTDITQGVFDRFRSMPIWRPAPLVGALLGDAIRYSTAAVMVIGVGLLLGFRPAAGVPGVFWAVLLLLAFAFSVAWIWTTLGLLLRTPASVMNMSLVVLTPLTFASNIFVDPQTMPGWLQAIVNVNPVSHLVTAVRGAMAGTVTTGQVGAVLVACVALIAIFAPLTMYLYANRE